MGVDAVLVVRCKAEIPESKILAVSAALLDRFGREAFWFDEPSRLALNLLDNRTCAEVSWWHRFYGVGYERGPLPEILEVAEFLREQFPGGVLLYGGDHDEPEDLPELTPEYAAELRAHYKAVGHEPYRNSFR